MEIKEYKIEQGAFNGVFAVPNLAADYLKIANGDNLKVLLYVLRHSGTALSSGEISRATGVLEEEVETSLEFWANIGVLGGDLSGFRSINSEVKSKSVKKIEDADLERDREFTPKEIADLLKSDKDAAYLYERYEKLKGKPLNHSEQNALAVILEDVGTKPEIVLLLIEYCFSVDKKSPAYIKAVAKDWRKRGLNSVSDVENEFKIMKKTRAEKDAPSKAVKSKKASYDLDELEKLTADEYVRFDKQISVIGE